MEEGFQEEYEAVMGAKRAAFDVGRKKFSPSYQLLKTLERYDKDFTKEGRYEILNEYEDFPDLGLINLDVFVSVLIFLRRYPEPKPEHFKDEIILPYFDKLFSNNKNERTIIRMKAQFLKYIVAINNFKAGRERIFEEIRKEEEEIEGLSEQYETDEDEE